MSRPTEDELIGRYFAPLARHLGADGLRDDAALLTPAPGTSLVVTVDALVEGIHFLPDDPPDTVARKAVRVNLSDLAAKGASPSAVLLALALPDGWTEEWLAAFAAGLGADLDDFGVALLGGDTVRTPGPLAISVTAFGSVPGDRIPRRGGARPGDCLYVSGTIGDAALGLLVRLGRDRSFGGALSASGRDHLVSRYRLPQPRLGLAAPVLAHASASMDVSDGLVGDLAKLLAASGATATLDLDAVPLSEAGTCAVAADPSLFRTAVTGGDDYEILLAVPEGACAAFEAEAATARVAVTAIGTVTAGTGPPLLRWRDGRIEAFGSGRFSHF